MSIDYALPLPGRARCSATQGRDSGMEHNSAGVRTYYVYDVYKLVSEMNSSGGTNGTTRYGASGLILCA
jgi:hypothetical protein